MWAEFHKFRTHPTLSESGTRRFFLSWAMAAAERLIVAVVNKAILDVLEHGEEAGDAESWLLSKDFDALQNLFH